jgi:rubrerythrin
MHRNASQCNASTTLISTKLNAGFDAEPFNNCIQLNRKKPDKLLHFLGERMPIIFNADEIYEIGVQIEKNGRLFYQRVASQSEDEDMRKLFGDLADWEKSHIDLFSKLKAQLTAGREDDPGFDQDEQKSRYLSAAAGSHVFKAGVDVAALAAGMKTPEDALALAVQFEKDSVVTYISMKNLVPEKNGKATIDRLIEEELHHIDMLQNQLSALKGER